MLEQRRERQQQRHREQRTGYAPDPGKIAQRDQDHHRVHGEACAEDRRGYHIRLDGMQAEIGGGGD